VNLLEFFSDGDPLRADVGSGFKVRPAAGDVSLGLTRLRNPGLMFDVDASPDLTAGSLLTNPVPDVVIQGPLERLSWHRDLVPVDCFRLILTPDNRSGIPER